jgi:hypothetical protein
MHRYEVTLTEVAQHDLTGDPVHVVAETDGLVSFWAERDAEMAARTRLFMLVGTGHPVPEGGIYRGTTDRTPGGLIWHLYELKAHVRGVAEISPGHFSPGHALER